MMVRWSKYRPFWWYHWRRHIIGLEDLDNGIHVQPLVSVLIAAHKPNEKEPLRLCAVQITTIFLEEKFGIHGFKNTTIPMETPHPIHQKPKAAGDAMAEEPPSTNHLDDQGAEVEDIRPESCLASTVGDRATQHLREAIDGPDVVVITGGRWFQPGAAEVAEARREVPFLEEDIAGLDGSMDGAVPVQVLQAEGDASDDVEAARPAQQGMSFGGEEVLLQVAIVHQVVY